MGATKDDGVDEWVGVEQAVDVLLYEIVCSRRVELAVLYQRHPHGTCFALHMDVGIELGNLQLVGVATDGAWRGQDAYVACVGEGAYTFGCGADDTQYTTVGVDEREVALLYGAECLG